MLRADHPADGTPIVAGGRVTEEQQPPVVDWPIVLAWLEGTALATWTRESPSIWAYPTILTLHTVGLGIVVGASAVIDFRLLGFAPRISLPSLSPLFRMIVWAFLLNAATGVLLSCRTRRPNRGNRSSTSS